MASFRLGFEPSLLNLLLSAQHLSRASGFELDQGAARSYKYIYITAVSSIQLSISRLACS